MRAWRKNNTRATRAITLIEVLVAMTILVLAMSGLYMSFSQGLQIYRRSEEGLDRGQELRIFLAFLRKDLRNMAHYESVPFKGKSGEIEFPTRVRKYTSEGYKEGMFVVRYKIRTDRVEREEEALKEKAGGGKEKREMVVLDNIRKAEFAFPYKDDETVGVLWQDIWDPDDNLGTPRGIRLKLQLLMTEEKQGARVLGKESSVKSAPFFLDEFFFVPQGAWGRVE